MSFALEADGSLWEWGTNHSPQKIAGLPPLADVAVGGFQNYRMARARDGSLWVWRTGQTPARLGTSSDVLAAGVCDRRSIIRAGGTVWEWIDWNPATLPTRLSTLANLTQLDAGTSHFLALHSDGSVWFWGQGYGGQLGDVSGMGTVSVPGVWLAEPRTMAGFGNVVAIAAGTRFNLVQKSDGTLWAWGGDPYAMGLEATVRQTVFVPARVQLAGRARHFDAGATHSIAVRDDGTVWTWGYNTHGELGDGTSTARGLPVQVSSLSDVVSVAAGEGHSLALQSDGTIWAWGLNDEGQVGNPLAVTHNPTPMRVELPAN